MGSSHFSSRKHSKLYNNFTCRGINFGEKENIANDDDGQCILFALNENDEFYAQ